MTEPRLHPDFWYPIARLLIALRTLLSETALEHFGRIALSARAQLAAAMALVRRYIHILAADIVLAPPRAAPPPAENSAFNGATSSTRRDYAFPLIESARPSRRGASGGEDSAELQWTILMEAVRQLIAVMNDPAPHARRLARHLRSLRPAPLRELPVRAHTLRHISPALDTLLLRTDQAARPKDWEGLWVDTS